MPQKSSPKSSLKRPKKTAPSSNLKGLIFDLDGTLMLTQHLHFVTFRQVFKLNDIHYTQKEDVLEYSGMGAPLTFEKVFAKHGQKLSKAEIDEKVALRRELYDNLLKKTKIELVPGVKKFLARMKKKGFKMAVASGNRLDVIQVLLKKTGIETYFSTIITNKDVKKPKPAPDVFLLAAKKIGCKPSECMVFEDAGSGIKAAKAGKFYCIALQTGATKKDLLKAGADQVVKNYDQINL